MIICPLSDTHCGKLLHEAEVRKLTSVQEAEQLRLTELDRRTADLLASEKEIRASTEEEAKRLRADKEALREELSRIRPRAGLEVLTKELAETEASCSSAQPTATPQLGLSSALLTSENLQEFFFRHWQVYI